MTPSDLPQMTRCDCESLLANLASDDQTIQDAARTALEQICYLPLSAMRGMPLHEHLDAKAARLQQSVALPCLLDALRDGHPRVRVFAANVLWVARERAAIPLLINCLAAPQKEVRAASADALGHLQDSCAVPPLIHLLHDVEIDVRAAAARSLGNIGDDRAVAALLSLLQSKHPRDRVSALFALGTLMRALHGHTPRPPAGTATDALPAIRSARVDPNRAVRKAAKSALIDFEWTRRHPPNTDPGL